jgi:hypothetical protein
MSDYPWTAHPTLVNQRIIEELAKRGWGDPKLYLSIPINWIDEFDVFDNFRFQDPYGLSSTGEGEQGRYYYIESITYDFFGQKMDIVAIDLQFLLMQYFIKGDENLLASNWSAAGEADRMFAYKCDETTGKFADGESGKILVDENSI